MKFLVYLWIIVNFVLCLILASRVGVMVIVNTPRRALSYLIITEYTQSYSNILGSIGTQIDTEKMMIKVINQCANLPLL